MEGHEEMVAQVGVVGGDARAREGVARVPLRAGLGEVGERRAVEAVVDHVQVAHVDHAEQHAHREVEKVEVDEVRPMQAVHV